MKKQLPSQGGRIMLETDSRHQTWLTNEG